MYLTGSYTGYSGDIHQLDMKILELGFKPSEYKYFIFKVAKWKQVCLFHEYFLDF